jgi:citrate synthase
VNKTLKEGRVIPGYGHAVLRNTDPRFVHLQSFAKRHIKDDEIVKLVEVCYETIPGVLGKIGKIKNPFPNVDAYSGPCLQHFGMVEYRYYTVVFAVSRAIGCLTNGMWSRAFGLPIERPNSIDMNWIRRRFAQKK